jgi:hypothetical protein
MKKILRNLFLAALTLQLTSCGKYSEMTRENFYSVQLQTPKAQLEKKYGKPLYRYHDENGYEVYEYVERVYVGNAVVEQNYYYFFIKDGVVQKKGQKVENAPAWSESYNSDPILDF